MATKKPRKRDLKARLGKTISPQGEKGGVVPPPGVGGGQAKPASGGVVPPPGVGGGGGGGVVPPPSIGGAPAGVPAPPFGKQEEKKKKSADPFAAQAPTAAAGPQEVRLVIDEKPVDDKEVGRKKRGLTFILLGVGLAVGLVAGYGAGSMMKDRELYNLAVRDGKDIYQSVRDASETINKAQRYVNEASATARGGQGKAPAVDYEAIEAIRALEKPLEAGAFARKRYNAFRADTVDSLFEYYNNVNLLWDKFQRLANSTLPENKRRQLDASVEAATNAATPTGCVPTVIEEEGVSRFYCGLVYMRSAESEEDPNMMLVRSSISSNREFPKTLFNNTEEQANILETPDDYVILAHPERSMGVLGEQASLFANYAAMLGEIKELLDRTIEIQGRLETNLGEIAAMEEVFSL